MIYLELLPWGKIQSPFNGETLWDKGLVNPIHTDGYWINWETEPIFCQNYIWRLIQEDQPSNLKEFLFQNLHDLPYHGVITTEDPHENIHILLFRNPDKI